MNLEHLDSLKAHLEKEFKSIGAPQEAKWVFEELRNLDYRNAKKEATEILARRKRGEPLAYVLGHWDFRKLTLSIGPGVLIPRPETEELVEHALEHLQKASQGGKKLSMADMGCGSGAIALSIAMEFKKELEVYAVEKSADALPYLKQNYENLPEAKKKHTHLMFSDWKHCDLSLDLLVSNPPYLSEAEYQGIDAGVRDFEPKAALVPERGGAFASYKSLFDLAKRTLKPGGACLFEFGPAQAGKWEGRIPSEFQWKVIQDLSGKDRFLYAFDFSPKAH